MSLEISAIARCKSEPFFGSCSDFVSISFVGSNFIGRFFKLVPVLMNSFDIALDCDFVSC